MTAADQASDRPHDAFVRLVCLAMRSKDSLVQYLARQSYYEGKTVDRAVARIKSETVGWR